MSDQKPRTEAEIIADWRAVNEQLMTADLKAEGYEERFADLLDRQADLYLEAKSLEPIPWEIARFALDDASRTCREMARNMRRPS